MRTVLFVILCAATTLHAAASMSIGTYRTTPTRSVTAQVYLSVFVQQRTNESGVCGFQFSLTYDPQIVLCTSAVTGSLVSTFSVVT